MTRNTFGTILVALCFGGVSGAALAQTGNPAGNSPLTPDAAAAPRGTNNADQLFFQLASIGGHSEVEFGELAAKKGSSDAVQQFGKQMRKDHQQANQKLERIAKSQRIELTRQYDPDHDAQRKYLNGLKGAEFDREYLRTQIAEHQRTALLLSWEIGSGQNKEVKRYAEDTLPTVMQHLQAATETLNALLVAQK